MLSRGGDPLVRLQRAEGKALLQALPPAFVRAAPSEPAVKGAPYPVVELLLLPGVRSAAPQSMATQAIAPGTLCMLAKHRASESFVWPSKSSLDILFAVPRGHRVVVLTLRWSWRMTLLLHCMGRAPAHSLRG